MSAEGKTRGEIGKGLLIFVGVEEKDVKEDADYLADKTANLRIFSNENGKFDYSVSDVNGEILSVSQFTLCADTRKGRRPDFTKAAKPQRARELYEYFNERLKSKGLKIETGIFAAKMEIELTNDGPVTIWMESKQC